LASEITSGIVAEVGGDVAIGGDPLDDLLILVPPVGPILIAPLP
jgi:hypothetical protein